MLLYFEMIPVTVPVHLNPDAASGEVGQYKIMPKKSEKSLKSKSTP